MKERQKSSRNGTSRSSMSAVRWSDALGWWPRWFAPSCWPWGLGGDRVSGYFSGLVAIRPRHAALMTERAYIEAIDQYPMTALSPRAVSDTAAQAFDGFWRTVFATNGL